MTDRGMSTRYPGTTSYLDLLVLSVAVDLSTQVPVPIILIIINVKVVVFELTIILLLLLIIAGVVVFLPINVVHVLLVVDTESSALGGRTRFEA